MLVLYNNFFGVVPSNKANKDAPQHNSKKKFIFGVFILLLVDVLWVMSSEFSKYIYTEKKLDRPFLTVYIRSSMLFIYLLVLCFIPPTKDPCKPADYTQLLETSLEADDDSFFNESVNSLGDSTFVPVRAGENTDSDDTAPRSVRFNKVAEVRVMSAAVAGEALLARLSWAASERASQHAQRKAAAAATRRHLRAALALAVPWFISNYLFRLSLLHTSPASATIYTSTAFALAISLGAMFSQSPTDSLTLSKCMSVLMTATGLVILGVSESNSSNWTAILSALGAAISYAVHLLMIRNELKKGEGINGPLFFGLVGCACCCLCWAMGAALSASSVERLELPTAKRCAWLLIDAALGPILADSLWLWGTSLTSHSVGAQALSLIPALATLASWRRGVGVAAMSAALLMAAAAALPKIPTCPILKKFSRRLTIRNIPELDEQSEALMSSEEPT